MARFSTQLMKTLSCAGAGMALALSPVAVVAQPDGRLIRVCSNTGTYYLPIDQDMPLRKEGDTSHACHAICHGQKKQLPGRPGKPVPLP